MVRRKIVKYCPKCGRKVKVSEERGLSLIAYCEKCKIEWEITPWYVYRDEKLVQAVQKFFSWHS